ncbi:MAG: hypothetical protein M1839_004114 [Geoglossum umbratile]|nr:MAG: hypothetical protein M1839_004114 [Geoglossum umbratile]
MAGLLADKRALEYDIIAIQEPWRNPFHPTTYNPVKDRFDLIYLESNSTRVCFFINSKLRGSWTHTHYSPDYAAIALQIQEHDREYPRTIYIYNEVIYKDIMPRMNTSSLETSTYTTCHKCQFRCLEGAMDRFYKDENSKLQDEEGAGSRRAM